jgi:hypothetical protein
MPEIDIKRHNKRDALTVAGWTPNGQRRDEPLQTVALSGRLSQAQDVCLLGWYSHAAGRWRDSFTALGKAVQPSHQSALQAAVARFNLFGLLDGLHAVRVSLRTRCRSWAVFLPFFNCLQSKHNR